MIDRPQVHAYAMMLGISGDADKAGAIRCDPGIYEVIWPGGVRYRDVNRYNAVVEKRSSFKHKESEVVPRAMPGQTFRIKTFVKGELQLHDAGKDVVAEVSGAAWELAEASVGVVRVCRMASSVPPHEFP